MQKPFKILIIFLIAFLIIVGGIMGINYYRSEKNVIIKNESLLQKNNNTYMDVRHIVLKGNNKNIGKALADIARENYQSKLMTFPKPEDKIQRDEYIKKNAPMLFERMKGVAQSFNLPTENDYDTSYLPYDIFPSSCSAIFLPPNKTANNKAMVARSMDFYTVDIAQFSGLNSESKGNKLYARSFVLEIYPDSGYPSLVIGWGDLMSGIQDGVNSEGLSINGLADQNILNQSTFKFETTKGLGEEQLYRFVLENAKNIEEARQIIENNKKIYFPIDTLQYLISDRSGKSMIVEYSSPNLEPIFIVNNEDKPQILTNHSVAKYQDISTFPPTDPNASYNTFNRFKVLNSYLENTKEKKHSTDDLFHILSLVQARTQDASEGSAFNLPARTLWPVVINLDDCSMQVKFYLNDGSNKTLNFSPIYTFKLKK